MATWGAHNIKVVANGINLFVAEKKAEVIAKLRAVASMMLAWIEGQFVPMPPYEPGGNSEFPVWRGHLNDATGVGLYVDGRTDYFMPVTREIKHQTSGKMPGVKIYGTQFLRQAITDTASRLPSGIWIVLFSAVPYAEDVNQWGSPIGRGMGFFDKSVSEMTNLLLSNLTPGTPPVFGFNI